MCESQSMTVWTPHGAEQGGPHARSADDRTQRGRPRDELPTKEELLAQLLQLNGLVALGVISPAKANVMQRNLKIVLDSFRAEHREQDNAPDTADLIQRCREHPELLNVIESFLTDDQIQMVLAGMAEGTAEEHGEHHGRGGRDQDDGTGHGPEDRSPGEGGER